MFYAVALILNFIMLAILPSQLFQGNRLIITSIVALYFGILFMFTQKRPLAYLQSKLKNPYLIYLLSVILVLLSFLLLKGAITLPTIGRAFLLYLLPASMLLIAKTKERFHPIDMLIFLAIFLPLELNLLKLPMVYDKNLITLDAVFQISVLFTVFSYIGFRKIDIGMVFPTNVKKWIETLLLAVVLISLEIFIGTRMNFLHFSVWNHSVSSVYILSIFMFFSAAFVEEIFFRGLIYNYLNQYFSKYYKHLPLIINSLLFGLTHINNGGSSMLLLSTIAGFFYCLTYVRTKNIFYSTGIHAVTNICWKLLFV